MLDKISPTTFELNMTNHFQNITIKQFQRKLMLPAHKQTLLRNTYLEEKYFTFFLTKFIKKTVFFCYCGFKSEPLINKRLRDKFIKRYPTVITMSFVINQINLRLTLEVVLKHYHSFNQL